MESLTFILSHKHKDLSGMWYRPEHREHFRLIREKAEKYIMEFIDRFNKRKKCTISFNTKYDGRGEIDSASIFKNSTFQFTENPDEMVIDGKVFNRI